MKLVPLGDRVVLKQCVAEETTKSGIVIPGQSKEKCSNFQRTFKQTKNRNLKIRWIITRPLQSPDLAHTTSP